MIDMGRDEQTAEILGVAVEVHEAPSVVPLSAELDTTNRDFD